MSEPKEPLSERELEILRLVATGAANKEIARQLVISPNTVKVHLRNIFTKIGVASRTEATLYAVNIGLVKAGVAQEAVEDAEGASASADVEELALENEFTPGLPGIQPEGDSLSSGSVRARLAARGQSLKIWQIGLILLAALVLISAGVVGSRFLAAPLTQPTVASISATPFLPSQRWSEKAEMPSPRKGMGVAVYENAFYLLAGETSGGVDGTTLRYKPDKNTWETLAAKPTKVTDIQAALLGEKIYVPGGRTADGKTADCLEVYDPRLNTWETKTPLPAPRYGYALAAFEGQLYLFGGKADNQYLDSVYVYNPQTNQWSARAPLNSPRAYASAIGGDGKIYVIGGYDGKQALKLNEAYIPARDGSGDSPWETLAPLPQGRYAMGVAHMVNLVYLLGGLSDNGAPASPGGIQYLTQSNQWAEFDTPTNPADAYPALLASGNFLYMIGGETGKGLSAKNYSYQAIYTITVPLLRNDSGQ